MPAPKILLASLAFALGAGAMWFFRPTPILVARAPVGAPAAEATLDTKLSPSELGALAADPVSALSDALALVDRDARGEKLRALAWRLAGDDPARALALGAKIPDAADKLEFHRALFAAWAAQEPRAALDHLRAHFSPGLLQGECLIAALEKWAAANPRDAWQWLDANTAGPLKEQGLAALAQGWVRRDAAGAGAWFISTGSASQTTLAALVSAWADFDARAAAEWVESLVVAENRALGRVALASQWAQENPAAAAEYFAPRLAEPGGSDLAAALVNVWGAGDPTATAAWIATLPAGPLRAQAAGTLATIWAASDIAAATRWSTTLEDPAIKASVIDSLGTTWGAIEPEKALAWLDTLPADEARAEATRGALDSWAGTHAPGLAAWLEKNPRDPRADVARDSLAAVQIDRDPAAALRTTLAIAEPTQRADSAAKFFRHWQRAAPAAARAWLTAESPRLPADVRARLETVSD